MSVAEAIRFDMLKKAATAAMSQMSRSLKPARRSARGPPPRPPRLGGELHGEIEHRALALAESRAAR